MSVTRLESFLKERELPPAEVARASGISRQHLLRMRKGTMDPTRRVMVKVATGCSLLLGRRVKVATLFNLAIRWRHSSLPPKPKRNRKSRKLSRLGRFMRERDIGTSNLAYRAGVNPNYISALKYGRCEPTRPKLIAIVDAVRGMIGRRVAITELFDLGDDERS